MPLASPAQAERVSQDLAIVVPTAGDAERLFACLHSLLRQTGLGSSRIFVVDNGDSQIADILLRRSFPADRIVVVREPRRGIGRARNAGLRAATAEWVVFTDDDCEVPAGWLKQIRNFLESNAGLHIAGGLVEEPERRGAIYSFMRRINYMRSQATFKARHEGIPSLGGANLACHRQTVLAIGGFDETLVSTEDYELLVRAHANNLRVGLYADIPGVIHCHRTGFGRFVRRYRGYGLGVGQTLRKHRHLDRRLHRVYVRPGSPLSIVSGALRFAVEDLAALRERRWFDGPLALLRAVAFQYGAWEALG